MVTLQLSGNPLEGPIPLNFTALPNLSNIFMARCGLTGTLPAVPLPRPLEHFALAGNGLSGTIPWAAWNMPEPLVYFNLSSNRLTGPLPPALPSAAEEFDLSDNALSGSLPAQLLLQLPPTLYTFDVSSNLLTGTLPQALLLPVQSSSHSSELTFDLSYNRLSGPVPTAWGFRPGQTGNATVLLNGNQLSGTLPRTSSLLSFHLVDLSLNRLTGAGGQWCTPAAHCSVVGKPSRRIA